MVVAVHLVDRKDCSQQMLDDRLASRDLDRPLWWDLRFRHGAHAVESVQNQTDFVRKDPQHLRMQCCPPHSVELLMVELTRFVHMLPRG